MKGTIHKALPFSVGALYSEYAEYYMILSLNPPNPASEEGLLSSNFRFITYVEVTKNLQVLF